jgi:hypothetical protein
MDLVNILKSVAPGLATVVAGPLGGAAVKMIADKLGVENEVNAVAQAIAGDPDAARKLAEIDLAQFKAEAEDRDSARKMQIAARWSGLCQHHSWLSFGHRCCDNHQLLLWLIQV